MARCALCRRPVLLSWERWDGARVCLACICIAVRAAHSDDEMDRIVERLRRMSRGEVS